MEDGRSARVGSAVTIEDISKTHGSGRDAVEALSHVSFAVRPSEFVSILGPSGCGKSTLMMILAGLYAPTSGSVLVDDKPVTKPLTDVGVVFQNAALLDWRTSLGNVLLQVEARPIDRKVARQRALEMLQLVGLAGFEQRRPYELSGGMKQRVAVVRALIHEPRLLVMDEPFGALDALTRNQLGLDLQRILLVRPATTILVTHSVAEAVFLSDRIVVMTNRPGTVDAIVDIGLPRPRRLGVMEEPEARGYVREIEGMFEARGLLRQ